MVYAISRFLFYLSLKIYLNFKVYGRENLPAKGPFILASNHESFLDPPIVGVACSTAQVDFMAKKELFSSKMGWWFRAVSCIDLDRNRAGDTGAVREALRRLKRGRVIAIFPEGQRSLDGKMKEPQAGIGFVAAKSNAPVVPIYIKNSGKALGIGDKRVKRINVTARIGKPLRAESVAEGKAGKKEDYETIAGQVMRAITDLKG